MDAVALTEQNFAAEVEAASTPVLIYFWGEQCGSCRVMGSIIDQVRQEQAGALKVVKVNAEQEMNLAARFNVRGMPSFVFLKDGQVKDSHTGAVSKAGILKKLAGLGVA